MAKREIKNKTISISIPIKLDEFLDRCVESCIKRGEPMNKSQLITMIITASIGVAQNEKKENEVSKEVN